MRLKLNFCNWDYEGEKKFIIAVAEDATFQDLKNVIIHEFQLNSFVMRYKDYGVLLSNRIADVLISNSISHDIHIDIYAKPDQSKIAPNLEKKVKINDINSIQTNQNLRLDGSQQYTKFVQQQSTTAQIIQSVTKAPLIKQQLPQITSKQLTNQAIKKTQQAEILTESESSDEEVVKIQAKKLIQNKPQLPQASKLTAIKQNNNKPIHQPAVRQVIPDDDDEDSSSSTEKKQLNAKKQTTQNQPLTSINKTHALNLNIMSPEQEFKKKAAGWPDFQKKFVPATDKPQVIGQQPKLRGFKEQKPLQVEPVSSMIKVSTQHLFEHPQLIKEGDKIEFKYTYLDLAVCEPRVSELTSGKVISNDSKKLQIHKVKDNESMVLNYDEIIELSIDQTWMNQERKDSLHQLQQNNGQTKVNQSTLVASTNNQPSTQRASRFLQLHDDQFKSIGKQVNFYYSDKNYHKDDFIQQHSALNSEKIMPVKLLLNFPKIKKILDSDTKLIEILEDFVKSNRTEEVNFILKPLDDQLGIKKKGL